jgi:hypothetical protein
VEDMLNLGHSALAAVFLQWQIRYNLVGVPAPALAERARVTERSGAKDPVAPAIGTETVYVKDFLRPVVLASQITVMESLPKRLRDDSKFSVEEIAGRLKPSDQLQAASLLSFAVRTTGAEEFRALITYDADSDDISSNRDSIYIGFKLP